MPPSRLLSVLFVVMAALLSGADAPVFDKAAMEAYARYLMLWGPDFKVEVSGPKPSSIPHFDEVEVRGMIQGTAQLEKFYVLHNGTKMIHGSAMDVTANPFQETVSKLKLTGEPHYGEANAPVTIVVFSDFECPFCRTLARTMKTNLANNYPKQVKVYFKNMPIAKMHPWATIAAIAGRCVLRQDPAQFWNYHDWMFEHQSEIKADNVRDKVMDGLKSMPLDQEKLGACLDTKATEPEVIQSMEEARELGVYGTPIVFVNGRQMAGPTWPMIKIAIDFELGHKGPALQDCHCLPEAEGPARK